MLGRGDRDIDRHRDIARISLFAFRPGLFSMYLFIGERDSSRVHEALLNQSIFSSAILLQNSLPWFFRAMAMVAE
jgi:hypothetical protein